ncbi:LacI family transcriptional regulator [Actinomyces ruminis]|uniref:LacI family transcriptional regulator n=1 Tax=Actinomyces ruminis TaxID=1937003 RepID=A0ABX4ME01_9ACTO|nr:LacI family transcriptional regulator [Actinomyces ruminis]
MTAADVARSLGLSRATVGYVLNDTPGQTIPEATRQRVLEAAQRLGYRPNQAARALASGRSRIVLLVLPDWPIDHSMRTHLDEVSSTLDRAGYTLVTTTPHPGSLTRPLWEILTPDIVMGLAGLTSEQQASITAAGARLVAEPAPTEKLLRFSQGPQYQVQHLIERGYHRIAYAGTSDPRLADLNAHRRRQAEIAAVEAGLVPLATRDVDTADAAATVQAWLDDGVEAVAAYNDDVAGLIASCALRLGRRVPEDLAVIGHDDTPWAALFVPSLSSVRIDTPGLGRYLAALALSAIESAEPPAAGPEFNVTVVRREST